MNLHAAIMLIRQKYLEEGSGHADSGTAQRYREACEKWPAVMKIAHVLFALEIQKNTP